MVHDDHNDDHWLRRLLPEDASRQNDRHRHLFLGYDLLFVAGGCHQQHARFHIFRAEVIWIAPQRQTKGRSSGGLKRSVQVETGEKKEDGGEK